MRSDHAMMGDGDGRGAGADVRGNGSAAVAGSPTEFTFTDKVIRTVLRDGEPWFVAADVCEVLEQPNVSQVVARLEDDERGLHNLEGNGGVREVNVISESGLYALVLTSRKPQAGPFQRWVTREVIPSIRRTGAYAIPKSEPYQRVDRGSGEPFHHAGMGTMAVSTSPGPHIGSLPSGDVTVTFADFMAFMYHGRDVPEELGRGPDHPNESQVLMYLARRGRGGDCARNPLNGRWVFKMAVLQDWYRNVGSIVCYQPR